METQKHWHLLVNAEGDLEKVIGSPEPEPPGLSEAEHDRLCTYHKDVSPEVILEVTDLIDLQHFLAPEDYHEFLAIAPLDRYMHEDRDIDLAARTNQPDLLRALLKSLDPLKCPITFNHYGYKNARSTMLGASTARALDYTIAHGTTESLGALLDNDTVVRTLLDNFHAYQSVANTSNPQVARRLQRSVYFAPGTDAQQIHRFACLNHRINENTPMDPRSRDSLRRELQAIAGSIHLSACQDPHRDQRKQVIDAAIRLDMLNDDRRSEIRFADGIVSVRTLIEQMGPDSEISRKSRLIGQIGEMIAIVATPPNARPGITSSRLDSINHQLVSQQTLQIPGASGSPIALQFDPLELRCASESVLKDLAVERLTATDHPDARPAADRLKRATLNDSWSICAEIQTLAGEPLFEQDMQISSGMRP